MEIKISLAYGDLTVAENQLIRAVCDKVDELLEDVSTVLVDLFRDQWGGLRVIEFSVNGHFTAHRADPDSFGVLLAFEEMFLSSDAESAESAETFQDHVYRVARGRRKAQP